MVRFAHTSCPYSFGAGVGDAIATYRKAAEDPKLLGALLLFGATPEIIHHYKVVGNHSIGFNEDGAELVRVPLKEAVVVRPEFDDRYKVYRTNVT